MTGPANAPEGAVPADPQTVAALYAGKTSNWNSGGFAFWGADGTFRSIGRKENAIAEGTWSVTPGSETTRLCYDADWRSVAQPAENVEICWDFVSTADGTIYERFDGNADGPGEWYIHVADKQVTGDTQNALWRQIDAKIKASAS